MELKSWVYIASFMMTLVSSLASGSVEPQCTAWFARNKLKFDDPKCLTQCATTGVDLGTFFCTDRCDQLCRPPLNCEKFRKMIDDSFTDEAPATWDEVSEKTKAWKESERQKVVQAMLRLPRKLTEKSSFKIHRMSVAKLKSNPASTKTFDVALYDRAFTGITPMGRILAHELAHVYWNKMTKNERKDYSIAANWMGDSESDDPVFGRDPKTLTEPDGAVSPTEDFANNVEYLLFDPQKLKKLTPSLFAWFQSYLGAKFELGGDCEKRPAKEK